MLLCVGFPPTATIGARDQDGILFLLWHGGRSARREEKKEEKIEDGWSILRWGG